jgi:thioredoxin reductase (NADPH)
LQKIEGRDNSFVVETNDIYGRNRTYKARKLILATGYYDRPNLMNVPGEELSKVLHYYREPHPFFGLDVLIVGGKNSAAIAALELWRHGARVTMVHRGDGVRHSVKYWIRPDIENRIKAGQVKAYFNSTVKEITPDHVVLNTPEVEVTLANDWVFALTGYHPDFDFLRGLGIQIRGDADKKPVVDPKTLESNVPGIYLAGVLIAGMRTSEIFIENGRFHGQAIAADLREKLRAEAVTA